MTCALNATHSSQMKTHRDSAGLRQPPSISLRTSFCDLPQNEQNTCSCVAVRDILAAPILASGNMSARTGDVNYSGEADQQFPAQSNATAVFMWSRLAERYRIPKALCGG